jgi:hypothetical protein
MKTEKSRTPSIAAARAIVQRVDALNWEKIEDDLDVFGSAVIPHLLTEQECEALASLYPREDIYRTRIVMARHGFGKGEYKYFDYPLPDILAGLRTGIYPHLVPMANRWNQAMRIGVRYPERHADFIETCHAAGQTRATPLILQYGEGDYNCLHQDLYGEHVFPLQVAVLLSEPGEDFTGGEFVMTEQRPRMQSRAEVVPLRKGDAVVFTVNLRHGVSRLRSGQRHTVGVIFHDSK